MTPRVQASHVRQRIILALALLVLVVLASLVCLKTAQGNSQIDDTQLGVSQRQGVQAEGNSPKNTASSASAQETVTDRRSSAEGLKQVTERAIVVKDPDPVVALAAVDEANERTRKMAQAIGTTKPKPTAPRLKPDTTGPEWHWGLASAYDLETNQGWDATALGVRLNRQSVTVAVPESQSYLLGKAVEIVYGDRVVVATITDTGGFEKYGRALDLAGGVWRSFGAASWGEWGVRPVAYRIL